MGQTNWGPITENPRVAGEGLEEEAHPSAAKTHGKCVPTKEMGEMRDGSISVVLPAGEGVCAASVVHEGRSASA